MRSLVAWVDRRYKTQIDLDAQPLRVEVVRFAEIVLVHLEDDGGGVVAVVNNVIVVGFDEAKV